MKKLAEAYASLIKTYLELFSNFEELKNFEYAGICYLNNMPFFIYNKVAIVINIDGTFNVYDILLHNSHYDDKWNEYFSNDFNEDIYLRNADLIKLLSYLRCKDSIVVSPVYSAPI